MSKITIIEPNSNDKDNVRAYMVKGERGDDGVSPTFETEKTGDTATITITDAEGTHEVELKDGVSPTVETSKTGKVTTVTITDAEGTHTATINDGEDGSTTNIIDSDTLTDNTTQTYSGRIVDQKIEASKTNFVTVSFTHTTTDTVLGFDKVIDYPTGTNKNNIILLTHVFKGAYNNETNYVWTTDGVHNRISVLLQNNNIYVTGWVGTSNTQVTVDLIFLKIN